MHTSDKSRRLVAFVNVGTLSVSLVKYRTTMSALETVVMEAVKAFMIRFWLLTLKGVTPEPCIWNKACKTNIFIEHVFHTRCILYIRLRVMVQTITASDDDEFPLAYNILQIYLLLWNSRPFNWIAQDQVGKWCIKSTSELHETHSYCGSRSRGRSECSTYKHVRC